jgi:hypothetical protein
MIAFVTLLLGLVTGVYPIEVTVGGPVARVEILLDSVKAAEISAPPWRSTVDLGSGLQPHELVARALDAAGKTLASTEQWVNLPRPKAEVEIVLESRPDGQPAAARLTWQSFDNSAPTAIQLTLDDRPLAIDAGRRAALPKIDLAQTHVLSAELHFGGGIVGRRDVVLGGSYGSQMATELTAIPLRVQSRARKDLQPAALQGRLTSGGEALAVAAVEEGPAKVLVVSVPGPGPVRERLIPAIVQIGNQIQPPEPDGRDRTALLGSRTEMRFDEDTRVRFVVPVARRVAGPSIAAELFDTTREFGREDGGLLFLLATSTPAFGRGAPAPQVAEAVAVAGLLAAAENRRRAVVLLLADSDTDASRYTAQQVRSFLDAIRVPLHVWNLRGSRANAVSAVWGGAEDVSTLPRLRSAFDKLTDDLESQRIALVEGRHLPRAVALKPGDAAVQLLGTGADSPAKPPAGNRP